MVLAGVLVIQALPLRGRVGILPIAQEKTWRLRKLR